MDNRYSNNVKKIESLINLFNKMFFDGRVNLCIRFGETNKSAISRDEISEIVNHKSSNIIVLNYNECINDPLYLAVQILTKMIIYDGELMSEVRCSNGYYLNHRFRDAAVKIGCTVAYDKKKYGFYIVAPPVSCIDVVNKLVFDKYYLWTKDTGTKKSGRYIRWVCPKCGKIARTTSVFRIGCFDCMEELVRDK